MMMMMIVIEKKKKRIALAALAWLAWLAWLAPGASLASPTVDVTVDGPVQLVAGRTAVANVRFTIEPELHLYQDTLAVRVAGAPWLTVGPLEFPPGRTKRDDFTKQDRVLHSGSLVVRAPLLSSTTAPVGTTSVPLEVDYQGCTDQACLMPQTVARSVTLVVAGGAAPPAGAVAAPGEGASSAERLIAGWGLLGYYLAGLLLSLTPCIFPMIPVTISIIGSGQGGPWKGFLRSVVYVTGLALTYAVLGLAAALGGGAIGAAMQNPWALGAVALLFFALGLSMLDVFELDFSGSLGARLARLAGAGWLGLFLTGMAAGLVASPCITPVLVGVLLQIATEGHVVGGFLKLFVFAWGLGTLLVVVGTFSSALSALPRAGEWMVEVKKVLGVLLMGAAFYFLQGVVPTAAFSVALACFLVVAAVVAGATDGLAPETPLWPRVKKAFGVVALVVGVYLLAAVLLTQGFIMPPLLGEGVRQGSHSQAVREGARWEPATDAALERARSARQPVLLDFGAEWCAACRELEATTFVDGRVVRALGDFVPLKVDMTRPTPETERLRREHGVVGFPTLVFLGADGKQRPELTQVGYVDAERFLGVLGRAR